MTVSVLGRAGKAESHGVLIKTSHKLKLKNVHIKKTWFITFDSFNLLQVIISLRLLSTCNF